MSLSQARDVEERHLEFITTCSGKLLNLLEPSPDDIDIQDIATGLSNNCRFSGQLPVHYSVASHSIILADLMYSEEAQKYALLHDASEAYIIDLPRPVKVLCPDYRAIEERIQGAVMEKFFPDGVRSEASLAVGTLDKLLPCFEEIAIKGPDKSPTWAWDVLYSAYGTGDMLEESLQTICPMVKEAVEAGPFMRTRYLEYFKELTGGET